MGGGVGDQSRRRRIAYILSARVLLIEGLREGGSDQTGQRGDNAQSDCQHENREYSAASRHRNNVPVANRRQRHHGPPNCSLGAGNGIDKGVPLCKDSMLIRNRHLATEYQSGRASDNCGKGELAPSGSRNTGRVDRHCHSGFNEGNKDENTKGIIRCILFPVHP